MYDCFLNKGLRIMNSRTLEGSKMRIHFSFMYPVWQRNQKQDSGSRDSLVTTLVILLFLFISCLFKSKQFFSLLISPFSRKNLYHWQSSFHPVIFPRRIMAKGVKYDSPQAVLQCAAGQKQVPTGSQHERHLREGTMSRKMPDVSLKCRQQL